MQFSPFQAMALYKPIYTLMLPFLFITNIPIFLFATLTTILAFTFLTTRVLMVYTDLAMSILTQVLRGPSQDASPPIRPSSLTKPPNSTPSRKMRRGSSFSASSTSLSSGDLGPSLSLGLNALRDYEGMGGWRLAQPSDDKDAIWASSRLEPPQDYVRRHRRSATGGSDVYPIFGGIYRSPDVINSRRTRTPPSSFISAGGSYFTPQIQISLRHGKKSSADSSASSKGSSGLNMKVR